MSRRDRLLMLRDVFLLIKERRRIGIAELMFEANVSFIIAKELTETFVEVGMLEVHDDKTFSITSEGKRTLRAIKKLQKVLTSKGCVYLGEKPRSIV